MSFTRAIILGSSDLASQEAILKEDWGTELSKLKRLRLRDKELTKIWNNADEDQDKDLAYLTRRNFRDLELKPQEEKCEEIQQKLEVFATLGETWASKARIVSAFLLVLGIGVYFVRRKGN